MALNVQEAEQLFLQGDFEKSFTLLTDLAKDEENGRALYLLSLFYFYGILEPENDDKFTDLIEKAWDADEVLAGIFLMFPRKGDNKRGEAYRKLMKLLREKAKGGDPFAMHQIGLLYQKGLGVKINLAKAVEWHEKAGEKGLVIALVDAGNLYLSDMLHDEKKAYQCYLKAAAKGYHEAEVHLGDCYYCGVGVEEDAQKAEICFLRAIDHGNAEACDALGTIYVMGDGMEAREEDAFRCFKLGAQRGLASCYYKWADCYFFGRGTDIDYAKALELYEKAWNMGFVSAGASIGMLYLMGTAGEGKEELGFQWIQKAADAGDVNGLAYLGNCYADGLGTDRDIEKAKPYLQEAAEQGQIEAVSKLGEVALEEENWFEAAKQFKVAAEKGYPRAENFMGILYAKGIGVQKNLRSAEEWFRRSEAQGDPDARMLMKQYLGI